MINKLRKRYPDVDWREEYLPLSRETIIRGYLGDKFIGFQFDGDTSLKGIRRLTMDESVRQLRESAS
jgi:hypothetical protein